MSDTTGRRTEHKDSGPVSNPAIAETSDRDASPKRTVEFDVATIQAQVVCPLCQGLFREPYTTLKCYHTFCKSCLSAALFSSCDNICPKCDLYLGRQSELSKVALPDRTLEALVDHVLFPAEAKADREIEAEFYKRRGMAKKRTASLKPRVANETTWDSTVTFRLVPDESPGMPLPTEPLQALTCPIIETNGSIRIGQLKTYLAQKLFPPVRHDASFRQPRVEPNEELEILCNSVPLGNELSVKFILRTVWMDKNNNLTLTYRRR